MIWTPTSITIFHVFGTSDDMVLKLTGMHSVKEMIDRTKKRCSSKKRVRWNP